MQTDYVLILVTAASTEEAEQISWILIKKQLVACVNIISPVKSLFRWKGELCQENETVMLLKALRKNFDSIQREIKSAHSYENPEIIALPIILGAEDYLNWIKTESV
ncbi:MAG TPA: divalent-cation tolerance protein CutA [bacterium]|nr:divalent-cation tolerance protein CutA [bacterium]